MFDENAAKHALDILNQGQTTMFIGAGVGVEAGLPDWSNAIIELSDYIKEYDRSISSIMLERVENKNLLSAAQFYFLSDTTQDIQIKGIEKIFGKEPNINRNIKNLIGLNVSSFITTNFDLTIENTWAKIKGKSLPSFSNADDDFISAHRHLNGLNPFVIHIHGIITKPMNLILSGDHFSRIKGNESYMTLLRHMMMNYSFLFVGFSFYDPAISLFLDYIKDKVQLKCEKTSFAAIPDNNKSLSEILTSSNIIPIVYESKEGHKGLWELIRWLYDGSKNFGKRSEPKVNPSENEVVKLKYNLASVYTHFRIRSQYRPVYESILKGIIHFIGYSLNFQKNPVTKEILSTELSSFLHIGNSEADGIVNNALASLILDKKVISKNSLYEFSPIDNSIDTHLNILVQSIKDRASVRYATSLPFKNDDIREFLLSVLVTDGVRLAHTILSKSPIPILSIQDVFEKCYDDMTFSPTYKNIFIRAAMSLFESPNQNEAKILGEISRTAFLTDLTLHEPDLRSLNISGTPKTIYLDASVLLPVICKYHPRHSYYDKLIVKAQSKKMKFVVSYDFLEEIISHKHKAQEIFRSEFWSKEKRFEEYVLFTGSDNINVYLGGFAGWYSETNCYDFNQYIKDYAPYLTHQDIVEFLGNKQIYCERFQEDSALESGRIARWVAALKDWYQKQPYRRPKEIPLIKHEATQLEALTVSNRMKNGSLFLTADKRLVKSAMEVCDTHHLEPRVLHYILMPIQFSYYLDLDEDREIDWRAYSKILWSRGFREQQEKIEEYFTDKILKEYEPKLLKSLPQVISDIKTEISNLPNNYYKNGMDDESMIREFHYLEQFDEDFYSIMNEEKKKIFDPD